SCEILECDAVLRELQALLAFTIWKERSRVVAGNHISVVCEHRPGIVQFVDISRAVVAAEIDSSLSSGQFDLRDAVCRNRPRTPFSRAVKRSFCARVGQVNWRVGSDGRGVTAYVVIVQHKSLIRCGAFAKR